MARIVYNLMKTFYATVWFYFIPFSVIYLSYIVPDVFLQTTEPIYSD